MSKKFRTANYYLVKFEADDPGLLLDSKEFSAFTKSMAGATFSVKTVQRAVKVKWWKK